MLWFGELLVNSLIIGVLIFSLYLDLFFLRIEQLQINNLFEPNKPRTTELLHYISVLTVLKILLILFA